MLLVIDPVYRCNSNCSMYIASTAATDTTADNLAGPMAALQLSSSQKHMCPVPVPSIMHTWSTMNRLICSCDVHVLLMLSYDVRTYRTILTQQPLQLTSGGWS